MPVLFVFFFFVVVFALLLFNGLAFKDCLILLISFPLMFVAKLVIVESVNEG